MVTATGALSDPHILRSARELRTLCTLLEVGLFALLVAAVLAFGSVHAWAHVGLWSVTLGLLVLLLARARVVRVLRRRMGQRSFAFHPTGLWIVLDEPSPYGLPAWTFDLQAPLLTLPPLLWPGLTFVAFACAQLLPLPATLVGWLTRAQDEALAAGGTAWLPLSVAPEDTLRGLWFVLTALALHLVAASVFVRPEARRRFVQVLAALGVTLAALGLAQMAFGTRRIYFFYAPRESDGGVTLFGPFANRNHYAACMAMLAALALGAMVRALGRYRRRVGSRANLRRWLVGLQSQEGTTLIYASVPALACLAALVAANSRGAVLAFALAFVGAGLLRVARQRRRAWALGLAVGALALGWLGLGRLGTRFERLPAEARGRTVVWEDTLRRLPGSLLTGSGLNTFAASMSRVSVWSLPKGATPWQEPYETSIARAPRLGYRTHVESPGFAWYREAHNDYLQMLAEVGIPGLLIVLWAALAALRHARGDTWLFIAVLAVLLHSLVDFPLQVPGVAALFAALTAWSSPARRARHERLPSD